MQFTRFCRDFDLVAKYAFSQAPSCTNFLPPGSASDSRTGCDRVLAFRLLHREKVTMLLCVFRQRTEWRKPGQGESAKDRLNALPPRLLHPARLLFLQRFYSCLIIPDSRDLCPKHNGCKQGKQKSLKQKKEYEDHCGRGTVSRAVLPVSMDASNEVMYAKK